MVFKLRTHPSVVEPGMIVGYYACSGEEFVHGVVERIYDQASDRDPIVQISGPYGDDFKHLSDLFEEDVPAWRRDYRSPPFYEVTAEDRSCFTGDPLLTGERQTTHSQLTGRRDSQNRKHPPWVFSGPPKSEHERWKRKQCLTLYQAGFDDSVPKILRDSGSWSKFWYHYSRLPHIKDRIVLYG